MVNVDVISFDTVGRNNLRDYYHIEFDCKDCAKDYLFTYVEDYGYPQVVDGVAFWRGEDFALSATIRIDENVVSAFEFIH